MFELVARQAAKYADSLDRNAAMAVLFNKSGREMNKLIAEIAEAGELNATVTEKQADEAKRLNDQLLELKMSSERLWRGLAADFVPALNAVIKAFIDARKEGGFFAGLVGAVAETFEQIKGTDLASKLREINEQISQSEEAVRRLRDGGIETIFGSDSLRDQASKMNDLLRQRAQIEKMISDMEIEAQNRRALAGKKGNAVLDPEAAAAGKAGLDLLVKLREEYAKLNNVTGQNETVQRTLIELQKNGYEKLTPARRQEILDEAALVDLKKKELATEAFLANEHQKDLDFAEQRGRAIEELSNSWEDATESLRQEASLLGLSNLDRQKAILLEKARLDIIAAGDSPAAVRDINKALGEQIGLLTQIDRMNTWQKMAEEAGNFFADLVMNGRSAFDNLRKWVKQLLQDMIALFMKRWILNLAAGGTFLGAAGQALAGGVGGDSLAGGLFSYAGSYASGAWSSYQAGSTAWTALTGSSPTSWATIGAPGYAAETGAAGAGSAGFIGSAAMWTGVGTVIAAAVIANMRYFSQGWRADNQDGWTYNGSGFGFVGVGDRIARGLGFNDQWASALSGSSLIARLFGHGATNADAYGISGTISGTSVAGQAWQDFSRRGGVFRSDQRWTDTADLSSGQSEFLNHFMSGLADVTAPLARLLGVNASTALSGYSRDFNFQLSNNGEMLSSEEISKLFGNLMGTVLQEQVATLLDSGGQGKLADYIRGLKEEGDALTAKVIELVNVMSGLKQLDLKGLDANALMAWQKGSETLGQAFDRVAGQITSFDDAFMTADQKLERSQRQVISTFADLGIAVPANTQAFYDLVHGLDLGTEAGRNMFDALMAVAPAFLSVENAAQSMMKGFDDLMGRIRPGYTAQMAGLTLTSDLSQFRSGNPWAAGLGDSELIVQLRTITREDFSHYDPKWQALILGILGIDSTMNDVKDATRELGQTMSGSRPWDDTFHQYYQGRQARENLGQYLGTLLTGQQSPLDASERLAAARRQYEDVLALAQTGDVNAIGQLQGVSSTYLQLAQGAYGSTVQYQEIFQSVFNALASIAEVQDYNSRMLDLQTQDAQVQSDILQTLLEIRDGVYKTSANVVDATVEGADKTSAALASNRPTR
jgi:hypothetical protein